MEQEQLPVRFEMRTSRSWIEAVDRWRRHQAVIPSRSAATRALVDDGLFAIDLACSAARLGDREELAKIAELLIKKLHTEPMLKRGPGSYLYDSEVMRDPEPDAL